MIKAKRGDKWYLWIWDNDHWLCCRCSWQGITEGEAGKGRTRDEAFTDLLKTSE